MTALLSAPLVALRPRITDAPPSRSYMNVRAQAAVVRALLDEVERLGPQSGAHASEQLVEELARLGLRVCEVATTMTDATREETLSGAA